MIEWYIDAMCSILNDLFWMSRNLGKAPDSTEALQILSIHHVPTSHQNTLTKTPPLQVNQPSTPTLALLLTTISRTFFRWRFIRSLDAFAQQHAAQMLRPQETQSWRALVDVLSSSAVPLTRFDMFLAEVDHYVKKSYDEAGWSDDMRAAAERTMVVTGRVPEVLLPVVQRLLTSALGKVLLDVREPGRLMQETRSRAGHLGLLKAATPLGGVEWDVMRKVPLFGLGEVKRCILCGSVAEDLAARSLLVRLPQWVLSLQKVCICGGSWVVA